MQKRNEQSVGAVIRQFLKMSQMENLVYEHQIAESWQALMGDRIAQQTDSVHLQAGCLYLTLKSPALKQEIMMQRTTIMRLLNEKLGSEVIKTVFVR